jgi:hypothetical protein
VHGNWQTTTLLKEQTPHGEFNKRIEIMNFTPRMAQKFMSAVLKFSKTNSNCRFYRKLESNQAFRTSHV